MVDTIATQTPTYFEFMLLKFIGLTNRFLDSIISDVLKCTRFFDTILSVADLRVSNIFFFYLHKIYMF